MYIYFILNKLTGKYYVGQTIRTPNDRWLSHKSDASRRRFKKNHFHNSLRKYGFENFEIRTLFVCYDRQTLNEAEVYFISFLNSNDSRFGYNGSSGGESPVLTPETRVKMSEAGRGKKQHPDHVLKRSLAITGVKRPAEVVKKFNYTGRQEKFSFSRNKTENEGFSAWKNPHGGD